jgi:CxxC motif-containing protein (DUF1111 family)
LNLLGDGFVEATDDSALLAIQAAQPADMRGTAISVPVLEAPGNTRIGRFGWKDQLASLLSFSSDAYLNEMGITNRFNLVENSSLGRDVSAFDPIPNDATLDCDPSPSPAPPGQNDKCGEDPERDIDAFTQFMRATKVPPRDADIAATSDAVAGEDLFHTVGCAVCHVDSIVTAPAGTVINAGTFVVPDALGNKIIHPFGDFLLHDIGTGDGIVQNGGEATRNMIRTAPLWGLRTHDKFMHDGGSSSAPSNSGAQSFALSEAILRHAGQATSSRNSYQALTLVQKAQLIKFLKSL